MADYSAAGAFPNGNDGKVEGAVGTILLRLVSGVIYTAITATLSLLGVSLLGLAVAPWWAAVPASIAGLVAYLAYRQLLIAPVRLYARSVRTLGSPAGLHIITGLLVGLLIGALFVPILSHLPEPWTDIAPLVVGVLFAVLGASTGAAISTDANLSLRRYFAAAPPDEARDVGPEILLDTSAIIDGRIADISPTGFLVGSLIVPRFILDELQHIADSRDELRRNRGRRGLEMLNKLRTDAVIPIRVVNAEVPEIEEVDGKLVKLAEIMGSPIVTTDFNLNRVAELQGVRVLNINDLANSLRPVVLPGEEMTIRIIQEGREQNQGVGYLDDGTMVVVEGGRRYIGISLELIVSRVLQTSAGRIIFAQPADA